MPESLQVLLPNSTDVQQVLALRLPDEVGHRSLGKDDTQSLAFFDVEVKHLGETQAPHLLGFHSILNTADRI